ncbi:hypothetical protein TNCV_3831711 [Trichonephila clavipes]|nr:hypothetical protein TNCV_3831711 [Trichonephila clavipes]
MPRVKSRNAYQPVSDFDKGRIVAYRDCGVLYRSIAACVSRNLMTISRRWNPNKISIHYNATRGLLATDHVILNHGQVTWTTPELAPPSPNYHTTPTGGRFSSRQI